MLFTHTSKFSTYKYSHFNNRLHLTSLYIHIYTAKEQIVAHYFPHLIKKQYLCTRFYRMIIRFH